MRAKQSWSRFHGAPGLLGEAGKTRYTLASATITVAVSSNSQEGCGTWSLFRYIPPSPGHCPANAYPWLLGMRKSASLERKCPAGAESRGIATPLSSRLTWPIGARFLPQCGDAFSNQRVSSSFGQQRPSAEWAGLPRPRGLGFPARRYGSTRRRLEAGTSGRRGLGASLRARAEGAEEGTSEQESLKVLQP